MKENDDVSVTLRPHLVEIKEVDHVCDCAAVRWREGAIFGLTRGVLGGLGITLSYIAQFSVRTAGQYASMRRRLATKKDRRGRVLRLGVAVPFTLAEYRAWVAEQLGGTFDGTRRCSYCQNWLGWSNGVPDHVVPIARGGDPGLHNLEWICEPCNHRKGQMSKAAFTALLAFAATLAESDRKDLLHRLEIAVQLAAGQRWSRRSSHEKEP
jgi:5-methylcytosine-specific restriction endonuclease McrA